MNGCLSLYLQAGRLQQMDIPEEILLGTVFSATGPESHSTNQSRTLMRVLQPSLSFSNVSSDTRSSKFSRLSDTITLFINPPSLNSISSTRQLAQRILNSGRLNCQTRIHRLLSGWSSLQIFDQGNFARRIFIANTLYKCQRGSLRRSQG
jgi:hypothetical protein